MILDLSQKQKIDRYAELSGVCKAHKPLADEKTELEKEIAGWFANEAVDKSFTVDGNRHSAVVSARQNKRTVISTMKLLKRLGKALFMSLCKVDLGDVDKHIPETERHQYISSERTGRRTVEAIAKPSNVVAMRPAETVKEQEQAENASEVVSIRVRRKKAA